MRGRALKTLMTGVMALTLASGLTGCGKDTIAGAKVGTTDGVELVRRGPGGTTRFMARNVLYRLDPNIAMFLTEMNADVVLKDPTLPFIPANKTDYAIQVHKATVTKGPGDLEALMNNYVFNDRDTPIKDVKMAFKGDRIVMAGKMKKGVWVGFEMEGTLEPTPDGKIKMKPVVIRSMGLRVDGLMGLFGLEMAKLLKMKEEKGLIMQGNEILMDPAKLYPPPSLLCKITKVAIANGAMHLEMDDGQSRPWPELPVMNSKSTLLMWGGDVLINSSLSLNSKMQILDATPQTPMVFALDRYREQLEAGFVVPSRAGHMIAYVPDVLNMTGDMGRYTPPTWPVPGIKEIPSDLAPGAGGPPQPTNEGGMGTSSVYGGRR